MLDDLRAHLGIPTQTCVLAHVSTRDCHIVMGRARSACGIDAVGPRRDHDENLARRRVGQQPVAEASDGQVRDCATWRTAVAAA